VRMSPPATAPLGTIHRPSEGITAVAAATPPRTSSGVCTGFPRRRHHARRSGVSSGVSGFRLLRIHARPPKGLLRLPPTPERPPLRHLLALAASRLKHAHYAPVTTQQVHPTTSPHTRPDTPAGSDATVPPPVPWDSAATWVTATRLQRIRRVWTGWGISRGQVFTLDRRKKKRDGLGRELPT
jgi:hypothetical protein